MLPEPLAVSPQPPASFAHAPCATHSAVKSCYAFPALLAPEETLPVPCQLCVAPGHAVCIWAGLRYDSYLLYVMRGTRGTLRALCWSC